MIGESKIIRIDRTTPFDPANLIGPGWTIDDEDERSLALSQVDLSDVQLEHMLKENEKWIKAEEKIRRLDEAWHIRLDARVFQTLWENQGLIPESWKEKTNKEVTVIFFDGTILRNPKGYRFVICLYRRCGRWRWSCQRLERDWRANSPSAVIADI